jgi:plastocyanin
MNYGSGNVIKTIVKTFNTKLTRHLLLISIYSQVVFGIGIALAIAAFVAIYVTTLASQNQTNIQQQQQIPSSPPSTSSPPSSSSVSTSITIPQGAAAQQVKTYYLPNPSTVTANSKVTWNNKDIAPHTATAIDGSFDTGIMNVGSSGSAIVRAQGTVPYHCTMHPWMNGILHVTS